MQASFVAANFKLRESQTPRKEQLERDFDRSREGLSHLKLLVTYERSKMLSRSKCPIIKGSKSSFLIATHLLGKYIE